MPDNERQPLLATSNEESQKSRGISPLPKTQFAVLMLMRLTEPIAMTCIFPFINQMIAHLKIAQPKDVGYSAGLVESMFAASQFLSVLQWGRASDRYGRRPILLIGLSGCAVSVLSFGFAGSLPTMIAARCVAGLLNGNAGVLKSAIGEITDETNEGIAFAFLPLTWAVGNSIGLFLGGQLAKPAERFPHLFGNSDLLKRYPYALPCIVASLLPAVGTVMGYFLLNETLPSKIIKTKEEEEDPTQPLLDPQDTEPPPTLLSLIRTPRIIIVLINYMFLALISISVMALIPLLSYTPTWHGGLGFTPAQIGNVLALHAIGVVFLQSFAFAPLQRVLGTVGLFRTMICFYPLSLLSFALASACSGTKTVWVPFIAGFVTMGLGNMAYSSNMIIVNSAAPSKSALGTLNGLAQTCSSLVRAIGPSLASSLFAFSINHPSIAGGKLVWIIMITIAILGASISWLVPKTLPSWRHPQKQSTSNSGRGA